MCFIHIGIKKLNAFHFFIILEKIVNKQGSVGSSENSKSPLSVDVPISEKDIVKPMPICNDLVYNYPASTTDGGEMKRFLFNDFVAQAAVANAGILSITITVFDGAH